MHVILVLSNGYGEDLVGARIASELRRALPGREVVGFPLVGSFGTYRRQGLRVVGSSQMMPSGGFARTSPRSLFRDLRAGLLGCLKQQVSEMRALSRQVELTVCVGDVFLLCLSSLGRLPNRLLVATAKSEYISGHAQAEVCLMRRLAEAVVARDQLTSDALNSKGVRSLYFGNFLMDVIERSGDYVHPYSCEYLVCLLPGSRNDYPMNLHDMLKCLEALPSADDLGFVAALARAPGEEELSATLPGDTWSYVPCSGKSDVGHVGDFVCMRPDKPIGPRVAVVSGRFGDVVAASDLVIGMAGTAVEQAVGLGKPAVTFPGRGAQFTTAFAAAQKRLLGDAVCLVESSEPGEVASEIVGILSDKSRYSMMSSAGVERMGGAGAARRFVEYVCALDGVVDGA